VLLLLGPAQGALVQPASRYATNTCSHYRSLLAAIGALRLTLALSIEPRSGRNSGELHSPLECVGGRAICFWMEAAGRLRTTESFAERAGSGVDWIVAWD
jgi:hypothetical protein